MSSGIPKKKAHVKVRGFFRVQKVNPETGQILHDTGWTENTATHEGINIFVSAQYPNRWCVGTRTTVLAKSDTLTLGPGNGFWGSTVFLASQGIPGNGSAQVMGNVGSNVMTLSSPQTAGMIALYNNYGLCYGQTVATFAFASTDALSMTYQVNFTTY